MGLEAVFIKRLSDTEPAVRILFINNAIGTLVSTVVALSVWRWPTAGQWLLLVALESVMVCAQTMFIQAMKRDEAMLVIPAFYSALVFAALYDFLFFGVIPATVGLFGAVLIVAGALILAQRSR